LFSSHKCLLKLLYFQANTCAQVPRSEHHRTKDVHPAEVHGCEA